MTEHALLEVAGLQVGYSAAAVVRGVNLQVNSGEIVCLLGPNGAGKTTTLLAISGLLPLQAGTVTFDGEPLAKHRPDAITRMGMVQVPEDRSLFGGLTVLENLQVATKDKSVIARTFEYFPALERISGRRASVLSGGEQQMLALARALAVQPKLLIIDEMSLGLAPLIVEGIFQVLRRMAADTGCAVLMVEQHVHLALDIADRAYVMSRGVIEQEGPAAKIATEIDLIRERYLGHSD